MVLLAFISFSLAIKVKRNNKTQDEGKETEPFLRGLVGILLDIGAWAERGFTQNRYWTESAFWKRVGFLGNGACGTFGQLFKAGE